MKKYWPLLLLAGAALFMSFRGKAASVLDSVKLIPQGISFGRFNLFEGVDFDASFLVQNSTPVNLKVNSFVGRLFYNQIELTPILSLTPLEIPPNGNSEVVFSGRIVPLRLAPDIIQAINDKNLKGKLRVEGVINTAVGRLPINMNLI